MTACPVFRLCLLWLAAIQAVSSATTTIPDPLPTFGPRKNYGDRPTDSKGRPPIVQRERLGNGTLSSYSWLEDPFLVDASLDGDNSNNNSGNSQLEKRVHYGEGKGGTDTHDRQGQTHEEEEANKLCVVPVWICDPSWNHAFTEACDILIADNLHKERTLPLWTYSLCYALDWDYWGDYQCCMSWTGIKTAINTSDLLPAAEGLYQRCQFNQQRLGYHVVSGRVIRTQLGGACASQCMSNRDEHCQ
ncbi:hypothetical protein SLS62_006672 [Diatrype stigma]|uniref:Uncharacterized protein n=1 Tax=Diatrype stigma TaxID=117547 RepID=A0AAN9YNX7_9PEZI